MPQTCKVCQTTQGNALGHDYGPWTRNGDGTHTRVCSRDASHTETQNCSGGTATCKGAVICTDCGSAYGGKNAENHANLVKIPAKAATTSAEGNIEYWYCDACGKYYKDAAAENEIEQKDTVLPKRHAPDRQYIIRASAGAGGSISPAGSVSVRKGRDQSFVITPDAGYAIGDVKINGESIGAASSYTFEKVKKAHTIEVFFVKQNAFTDIPNGSFYEDAVR